jgi:hypothetical protein
MSDGEMEFKSIEINEEFHTCPDCGYRQGFHVAFRPEGTGKAMRLLLICPSCGARFDPGRQI